MRYLETGTNAKISKIGLGTWQFGSKEWGYGEKYADGDAHAIVRRALDLGVTLFDTAEIYGSGRSERILGQALGPDRQSAFLATKIFPLVPVSGAVKWRARASAKRLGTPVLDLYQVHWPNPLVPDRTLMKGMRELQRLGMVEHVGVSGYSLERWCRAEAALGRRILSNQVRYSLLDRSPELDLLPFAESEERVIIAFSPLESGLLSGKYDSDNRPTNKVRVHNAKFGTENLERLRDLLGCLREIAHAHSATVAQIALAWVIRSPAVAAIPGASNVEQLEHNVAAADIQLRDDEYQALQAASDSLRSPVVSRDESILDAATVKHMVKATKFVGEAIWNDLWNSKWS